MGGRGLNTYDQVGADGATDGADGVGGADGAAGANGAGRGRASRARRTMAVSRSPHATRPQQVVRQRGTANAASDNERLALERGIISHRDLQRSAGSQASLWRDQRFRGRD